MPNYYLTFCQRFPEDRHPNFVEAHRDGWVTIVAEDMAEARSLAFSWLGEQWAFIYDDEHFCPRYFPLGELARIPPRTIDKAAAEQLAYFRGR